MEQRDFGPPFALFLHYELRKILRVSQTACKEYNRECDRFKAKIALYHPYRNDVFLEVPRLAPPASKLTPLIRSVESKLGVQPADNGQIALRSFAVVFQELFARYPGMHDMPALHAYMGGQPIVIYWDATGFGALQLTTIALRNPYLLPSHVVGADVHL